MVILMGFTQELVNELSDSGVDAVNIATVEEALRDLPTLAAVELVIAKVMLPYGSVFDVLDTVRQLHPKALVCLSTRHRPAENSFEGELFNAVVSDEIDVGAVMQLLGGMRK